MNDIAQFKGLHNGKRLFILASGPSLGQLDLNPLSRRMVMGLNRSFLIYANSYYHCTMDHRLFEEYSKEMKGVRQLFTLNNRPYGTLLKLLGAEGFSWDLTEGIYSGYTVSYFALQVAVYMGFKEIFFLGLDLKHVEGNTHFFGYDYHSSDHETTEFLRMNKMMNYAQEVLSSTDIKVFNCSPISTLNCFERVTFEDALRR